MLHIVFVERWGWSKSVLIVFSPNEPYSPGLSSAEPGYASWDQTLTLRVLLGGALVLTPRKPLFQFFLAVEFGFPVPRWLVLFWMQNKCRLWMCSLRGSCCQGCSYGLCYGVCASMLSTRVPIHVEKSPQTTMSFLAIFAICIHHGFFHGCSPATVLCCLFVHERVGANCTFLTSQL